jgi:hypothetical protein
MFHMSGVKAVFQKLSVYLKNVDTFGKLTINGIYTLYSNIYTQESVRVFHYVFE